MTRRCVPLTSEGGEFFGFAQVTGPLTNADRQAVANFAAVLRTQHARELTVTDQTQPDQTKQEGVDLTAAGVAGWYLVLEQIAKKREELDGIEKQAQDAIKTVLGDRVDGLINGKPVVRWLHTAAPKRFDKKALGKDHPELVEQYTVVGEPGRRFELVKPKASK